MTPHRWETEETSWQRWTKWACDRCGFWYRTNDGRPPPPGPLGPLGPVPPVRGGTMIPEDCDEALVLMVMEGPRQAI